MASKRALDKLQETVVGTVRGVAKDPIGTAKGAIARGRAVAGQLAGHVSRTIRDRLDDRLDRVGGGSAPAPSAPAPALKAEPEPEQPVEVTPADVARVVEKKPPAAKKAAPATKAPPKKAPARKSTPSAKLPPKKKAD